jgi:natural product precursor
MRRLDKLKMKENAEILNDREMKLLVGGYSSICYWEDTTSGITYRGCTNNPDIAYAMGEPDGHWECNTQNAYTFCRDSL